MKNIITNNGKFNITNALYESIKKNNPDLLIEDYDESFNVFSAYNGKIKDIIQKLGLNQSEENELIDRLQTYERGAKDSFGTGVVKDADKKVYNTCMKYLDTIYNNYPNKKDFLTNFSGDYDPEFFAKEKMKNQQDKNDGNLNNINDKIEINSNDKLSDEEILDGVKSSFPLDKIWNKDRQKIIDTYNKTYDESNGNNEKAWDAVGKVLQQLNEKVPFKEYIENYDGMDSPIIDFYIRDMLSKVIPNKEYVEEAVKRYMKDFRSGYTDTNEVNDDTLKERLKDDMIDLYNKVNEDCIELQKLVKQAKKEQIKNLNNKENNKKITEASNDESSNSDNFNNSNIYKNFAEHGINYVKNHFNEILSGMYINGSKEYEDAFPYQEGSYKKLSENELKNRVKVLQSSYITNDTIEILKELYKNYIKNSTDDSSENDNNKIKCIKNVYNAIKDGYSNLKGFMKNNSDVQDENTLKEIKKKENNLRDMIALKIRKYILGVDISIQEFDNLVNNFSDEKFDLWYEENKSILNGNDDLLKYLNDNEWNIFSNTLDYPYNSSVKNGKESVKSFVKRIINVASTETFDSKIPGVMVNFVETLRNKLNSKIFNFAPFLGFYDFGTVYRSFLKNQLKNIYIDLTKNEGDIYRQIKMCDIYRYIDDKAFWKNACMFHCWSHKVFNTVLSMISEMSIRDELHIYKKIVTTGLPTSTIIYTISCDSDDGKYELRDGGKLKINNYFNDKNNSNNLNNLNINNNDKKIIDKINRKYFIVVTEGIVNKEKIAKGIYNGVKGLFNQKSKNNILGIDTSNMRYR